MLAADMHRDDVGDQRRRRDRQAIGADPLESPGADEPGHPSDKPQRAKSMIKMMTLSWKSRARGQAVKSRPSYAVDDG